MIITLCGSTRFKKEFLEAELKLSKQGHIVLSICQFSHADNLNPSIQEKQLFDKLHLYKIKNSDAIYVINKDGYIGKSTCREIQYAESLNKQIMYME